MQTTVADPIIAEVRAIRDKYAAHFDYDVAAIFNDLRVRQETSERVYVCYPARSIEPDSALGASAHQSGASGTAPRAT